MTKPGMIITGATGFLGGRLIRHCCHRYRVYSVARRPVTGQPNLPPGTDVTWFEVDIGDFAALEKVFAKIRADGGAKLLLHLAGYYDFTGDEHPEYHHSNVVGTRNVLELSAPLELTRFYFASSIAACPFPPPGGAITESTPPTAPPPYSQSKAAGEALLAEYADRVPSCILRLAAIFSNWCEYEPLFNFLDTWFSRSWNNRVLGGHGEWAIPYLHVRDLLPFFMRVIDMAEELENLEVLQASPNGCTSMRDLFEEATRCYYGKPRRYIYVPKLLAWTGIRAREQVGRITGKMPFERSWMGEYIDLKLNVDASATHRRLGWEPSPDLDILDCISSMVHNREVDRVGWQIAYNRSLKGKPLGLVERT